MIRPFRILALLLAPALVLAAQGRSFRSGGGPCMGSAMAARLHQIRMARIQEAVGLPEARARTLADRWARFDREHMEASQRLHPIRQRFQALLQAPLGEEARERKLRPLLDQFMVLREQQTRAKLSFETDLHGAYGLSATQQARFILLTEELQQELTEQMRETFGRRRGRPF